MSKYLENLSADLEVAVHNSSTLHLPAHLGKGFIKHIPLEKDLYLRYYNFELEHTKRLSWFYDWEVSDSLYKLKLPCWELEPDVKEVLDTYRTRAIFKENIQLHKLESPLVKQVPAKTRIYELNLIFTGEWLSRNSPEGLCRIEGMMRSLEDKNLPACLTQTLDPSCKGMLKNLVHVLQKDLCYVLDIKTASYVLINSFMDMIVPAEMPAAPLHRSTHCDTIEKVEQRLHDYLTCSMPAISALAAEFNMTPITLQRHFKMIYGKNIYQYYLELKFAKGKELIDSNTKTVGEVAHMMGYHKINSFSRLFKKYYGCLPRQFKKKG